LAGHRRSIGSRGAFGLHGHDAAPDIPDGHLPDPAHRNAPPLADEKAALTKALSQTVTNPSGAQFKWLPVAINSSGPIGYCGLVNVKGSFGEYVGFRRFFAMISKGPKGEYIKGQMEHIDGIPPNFSGISPEAGTPERGLTEENCKEWGYADFSTAS
jgi:hypothetical protein